MSSSDSEPDGESSMEEMDNERVIHAKNKVDSWFRVYDVPHETWLQQEDTLSRSPPNEPAYQLTPLRQSDGDALWLCIRNRAETGYFCRDMVGLTSERSCKQTLQNWYADQQRWAAIASHSVLERRRFFESLHGPSTFVRAIRCGELLMGVIVFDRGVLFPGPLAEIETRIHVYQAITQHQAAVQPRRMFQTRWDKVVLQQALCETLKYVHRELGFTHVGVVLDGSGHDTNLFLDCLRGSDVAKKARKDFYRLGEYNEYGETAGERGYTGASHMRAQRWRLVDDKAEPSTHQNWLLLAGNNIVNVTQTEMHRQMSKLNQKDKDKEKRREEGQAS